MKKIYLAVFAILTLSVFLFTGSLLYLDREKHKVFFYTVSFDGHDTGNIKIDKYITDDNVIYKSVDSEPFGLLFTETRGRITLDRFGGLISYLKESACGGAQDTVYLESSGKNISFVATSESEFAYLTGLGVKEEALVFEEGSPVTYLPILERYDFKLGRSQAFDVLTIFSTLLPPMKRLLTLTSTGSEYIKVGSRKIKAECLLIRIRNSPQGMLWVTKSARSIVKIEFPDLKLKITRTNSLKKVNEVNKPAIKNGLYDEQAVKFNSKKTVLEGTLTIPKKRELLPAVLLLGRTNGSDREDQGLFTQLAGRLGEEGFVVLRFDGRGIGSSGGTALSATSGEQYEDSSAAMDYLLQRKEIDVSRVAVIGHGEGAFFASKLASDKKNIYALILMSPMISLGGETDISFDNLNEMAKKLKWDDQYLKLVMKSRMETVETVKKAKGDWVSLLSTRCFLKKLREDLEANSIDIIRKVEVPVLILHGKEDEFVPAKAASTLDKALEDSGNINHKLIYYGYLGHFFGKIVTDGLCRMRYSVDESVLSTIKEWLDKTLPKIDSTSPINE
ncbi:MAG: alpha/beta hydrolase [Candidatus Omnitrophica bacterium]|nr:alpha/beta hydrolase [Candidatus Omnitrophota bacterium]